MDNANCATQQVERLLAPTTNYSGLDHHLMSIYVCNGAVKGQLSSGFVPISTSRSIMCRCLTLLSPLRSVVFARTASVMTHSRSSLRRLGRDDVPAVSSVGL